MDRRVTLSAWLGLGIAGGLLCGCGEVPAINTSTSGAASTSSAPASCSGAPDVHVYHPDRLQLLAPCITVDGTVESTKPEADGDVHIGVRLDPGQTCAGRACINSGNISEQHRDLVLEPVCEHDVTQQDAVAACAGYRNPLQIPVIGTHVSVSGPWVLDTDHGWDEIHPLETVRPV